MTDRNKPVSHRGRNTPLFPTELSESFSFGELSLNEGGQDDCTRVTKTFR